MFDAIIAGGGLSGLSLAAHLAAGPWRDRKVLLVDDDRAVPTATAWASWSARPGLLDAAVSRSFDRIRIHAGGVAAVLPLGRYRYGLVRRDALRRTTLDRLRGCPGFAVETGHVEHIDDGGTVMVDGRRLEAAWVFDSVTRPPPGVDADARLAFTGWRIRAPAPSFDPDTPTLFDFRVPQPDGARFAYVLPDDATQALVELTEFVPRHAAPPSAGEREAALQEYIRHVLGIDHPQVLATESAVLPLRVEPPRRARGRVMTIGARAGLVKASTGYAYQRIQDDSAAVAASLARHGHPFAVPAAGRRHRWLDAVLLRVLDRDPAQLETAFARLFTAHPAERILRFLDERSPPPDDLRIVASLPPAPYLRALLGRRPPGPKERCGQRRR
jgi:lycopene beta-cyclase